MNGLEGRVYRWLEAHQPATIVNLREQFREFQRTEGMRATELELAVNALVKSRKVRVTGGKFYRSDMPVRQPPPKAPRKRPDPRQGNLF